MRELPPTEPVADQTPRPIERSIWLRVTHVLYPTITLAVIVGIWQLNTVSGLVHGIILPPPADVFSAFWGLLGEPFFWTAVRITIFETLAGFLIGVAIGIALGSLIASSHVMRLALYPFIIAFQNTPRVAFAPVLVTAFGFGLTSKIAMAAAICFFPLLINVVVGIDTIDDDARSLMRSYGASKWTTLTKLTFPSALPVIFAGLKTALSLALIGAIVAEFVGAAEGLGVLINTFNFQLDVAEAFAVVIALSLIGLALYGIMELLDRKIVFWVDR
jgi:NitT/TauT family transport system permease protein